MIIASDFVPVWFGYKYVKVIVSQHCLVNDKRTKRMFRRDSSMMGQMLMGAREILSTSDILQPVKRVSAHERLP